MEDASKEFQIFLSPTRDFFTQRQQQHSSREEPTATKHRIVPVINKMLLFSSTSSSSSFTLNQRKSSVYKAVSGVSFQDTDRVPVERKKPGSKREKREEKRRERRQHHPHLPTSASSSAVADADSCSSCSLYLPATSSTAVAAPPGGAPRRSRSLTSVESASADVSSTAELGLKKKTQPEVIINHPFSPVILYNQSSGRKSRYARVKERQRSSSQVRSGGDYSSRKHEGAFLMRNDLPSQEPPVRPRRARSASRSRKPLPLTSFSSENNLEASSFMAKDISLFPTPCEKQHRGKQLKQSESCSKSFGGKDSSPNHDRKNRENAPEDGIDFSVNDDDWRKYDILVTEKLDTLLKKKEEEPEGGYFSLEREESEESERFSETGGDHFQRDNSSETIYVAQTFSDDNSKAHREKPINYGQYTVEEIYSEVPFGNHGGQEEGFVDDEGLYEEIFFDRSNEPPPKPVAKVYHNESYGESSSVSIRVTPTPDTTRSMPKKRVEVGRPKIEKSSSTTIVYIGNDSKPHQQQKSNSHFYLPIPLPPHPIKQSSSCSNLTYTKDGPKTKEKKLSVVDIVSTTSTPSEDRKRTNTTNNSLVWCGCQPSRNNFSQSGHSSSCLRSRSGVLSTKYARIGDSSSATKDDLVSALVQAGNEVGNLVHNLADSSRTVSCSGVSSSSSQVAAKSSSDCCSMSTNPGTHDSGNKTDIPEPDYELSDIDLDMFAPKSLGQTSMNLRRIIGDGNAVGSVPEMHSNLKEKKTKKDQTAIEVISPKTFRGFLEDALFNPPDAEASLMDEDTEDLVLKDDQIITCITDTESSTDDDDSEDDDEGDYISSVTSPWLEAHNEFEYVAFKDDKSNFISKFSRKKKSKRVISIPKLFGSAFASESTSSFNQLENSQYKNAEGKRVNNANKQAFPGSNHMSQAL